MSSDYESLEEWAENEYGPTFYHGVKVGKALGNHETYSEALAANAKGEIELWFEFHRPKTGEEWIAWEAENGPVNTYAERWKN